ncbi:MAG: DNA polymerase III subunit gamma/tau [Acidimicrobiaceae bacterium]|nr:DNA polymerase III subunit gamma/tau [Acidimicrobiaceae bacterium]
MAYQSLYRRYRPQKFSEIRGQTHVVAALRNAVAKDRVGHAYMFSGPRGTGKTSSARVLAKALNCENLGDDSEPCGACESCTAIEQGRSFDLHELDAASNNGVEDMRDLLGKVNLGNPGRVKVYILDEVHMLTRGAENSLLKTLEEPPGHVVWVLATTEPHKVVETIRSRCQVFELGLFGAEEMTAHVRWVIDDAGLEVDDGAVDYVVSVGGGSVRDTLSALDRVVAAGGVVKIDQSTDQLLHALAESDTAAALGAVGDALGRGRDPRAIGEMLVAGLRDAFLTAMGSPPPRITVAEQERASQIAEQVSPLRLTRALETLGTALVEMRQAPDPRVHLEVALVRLCRAVGDNSVDSLMARVEQLEARLAAGAPAAVSPPAASPVAPAASSTTAATPEPARVVEPKAAEPRRLEGLSVAPKLPPAPQPVPSAQSVAEEDLRSLQPKSAKEVVELAGLHLSLGRNLVVTWANSFLGPAEGKRSEDDLQRLWRALVDEFGPGSVPDAPAVADEPSAPLDRGPAADPPQDETRDADPPHEEELPVGAAETADEPATDADMVDTDEDGLNLDELIDASSHTDQVVELLEEAFPGAEIEAPPAAKVDQ